MRPPQRLIADERAELLPILRTLDDAELANVKVPTADEIRAALARCREQFRKASGSR